MLETRVDLRANFERGRFFRADKVGFFQKCFRNRFPTLQTRIWSNYFAKHESIGFSFGLLYRFRIYLSSLRLDRE